MNRIFNKIKLYIDYNNSYSIRKVLKTIKYDFDVAIKSKNTRYAKELLATTRELYDDFSRTFRESEDYGETMSGTQRIIARQMRDFISYLAIKLNEKKPYAKEINDSIGNENQSIIL